MVNLYCTLIINKRKSFSDIPASLQEEVKARLLELGYDENGENILTEP